MTTITEMAALLMAVLYLLLGESTARSPVLVRALLTGMVIGALGEAVVVVHDFFLPMWFPDRHPSRVRGTFRASGQLAQYGFTVAGILLTFGWTYFQRNWTRLAVVAAGFLGAFFVVAASRRSGMFALAVWLGLFLLLGLRSASRRAYMGVMAASFLGLVALIVRANEGAGSYIVDRFLSALEGAVSGDSYVHQQFNVIMSNLDVWLPIGTGIGNGHMALTRDGVITAAEIHNGHLALAVELGLLGLIAFYILCARALCRRWEPAPAGVKYARAVKPVFLAFVLAATVFMIHNRLHRDRGFALFLGLAPTVAVAGGLAEKQQRPGPHRASGGWRVTGGG